MDAVFAMQQSPEIACLNPIVQPPVSSISYGLNVAVVFQVIPRNFPHQFFKRGFLLGPFRLQVNFSSLLLGNIWNYSLLKTPSPSMYGTQGFPNSRLFNPSAVCPWPLRNRVLHRVRSSASSFHLEYPLFSSRSSSSCLRLLHCHPITFVLPYIFLSIRCFRRKFQMVPQFINTDDYASVF